MPQITTPQVKTLRSLAARALPDDEAYRAFLWETFGEKAWSDPNRPSTLDLTQREGSRAIRTLILQLGTRPAPPHARTTQRKPDPVRYRGSGRPGLAKHLTERQAGMIAHLEDKLGWTGEPERLLGFIEKQLGKRKAVPMLTLPEATKVITGLMRLTGDRPHPRARRQPA